ncbi:PadR family transcriptional regulator [Candidatus Woesebacteria bacterium]|nr:PadR family transcriptional regulator [Candidatus Woesebacteria bacterium]
MRTNCSLSILENFFEPCVLALLLQNPSYGYELQKNLNKECMCSVNMGNLYRCLARMTKQKYVIRKEKQGVAGPTQYVYTITAKGKKYLASWIQALAEQEKSIQKLITYYHSIV